MQSLRNYSFVLACDDEESKLNGHGGNKNGEINKPFADTISTATNR
jgi:hypothetical protein